MASNSPSPVVVGVDGSSSSIEALDYAARWAARHRTSLRIVHALVPLYNAVPYGPALVWEPGKDARAAVEKWLRELAGEIRRDHPGLAEVQVVQADGHSAGVLIGQSRHAAVTVVGRRGLGGFAELVLGSTSANLATYGHGAIVVAHPLQHHPKETLGPVLACYDGSPASVAALRFAADEAAVRDVPLTVVHVYDRDDAAAKQLLIDAVEPWADDYTGKQIELRPVYSANHPQYALLEVSRNAALTVVGARGRGGLASLLLGSVSRYLIHHAYGPVAVIHPAPQGKEGK